MPQQMRNGFVNKYSIGIKSIDEIIIVLLLLLAHLELWVCEFAFLFPIQAISATTNWFAMEYSAVFLYALDDENSRQTVVNGSLSADLVG